MSILSNIFTVTLDFKFQMSNMRFDLEVILQNLQIDNDLGNFENFLAMFS